MSNEKQLVKVEVLVKEISGGYKHKYRNFFSVWIDCSVENNGDTIQCSPTGHDYLVEKNAIKFANKVKSWHQKQGYKCVIKVDYLNGKEVEIK